ARGDVVTAEGHIVCGDCIPCRTGNAHLCVRTQIIGVDRDGAFADYIAMPATNVMKLDGIAPDIGAIMGPVGNAVPTALERGDLARAPGPVSGCGPLGCCAVGPPRSAGAAPGPASGRRPRRRT